ncbi:hypothetical protein BDN70DRAFT_851506 [Pholiota conissans]|uniref:F-box domain-containing protein n=1 Tax=Pholiota conissans TaxID=109636 RepID=A0A9P5ZB31_9AGAR|nr:hypothetical protein BDN70DRAFT_851506 [Pholiota conissans]
MPPKLRVLAHNARLEKRMQNDISTSLASVLKTNPKMELKEAMWSVTQEMLVNNPFQPPKDGKCPFNDLPDEILGYIFSVGVKEEAEEGLQGYDSEDDADWEDADDEDDEEQGSGDDEDDEEMGASVPTANAGPAPQDSDSGGSSDSDMYDDEVRIPFQVLVSHVCHRWRAVALDSHVLWTTLNFEKRPNLEKAETYISRAQGLPLTICIDCTFPEDVDEEDHPDHPLYTENHDDEDMDVDHDAEEEEVRFLSNAELTQILDLIEPEVSHWGSLEFRASTYTYVTTLLSRLAKLPSAPLLEAFQVYHFEDCEDYEFFSGDDKTSFLPFHGDAPLLKDAVFWGIHIDWEGAAKSFLTGLRDLELSFHAKDVRPSYDAFYKIISSSPDLQTLTLSLSGPVLSDGVEFDAEREEGGWGSTPLTISSLREFAIQFHDPKYASALVQHLDMPNVTGLLLNFDEQDYTTFVRSLLKPVKGRTESLLQHIDHLKISGLPCDVASAHAFLDQLVILKSFNLKVTIVAAQALAAGAATSATASGSSSGPLSSPTLFCPKLETLTTNAVDGYRLKQLVETRKKLGAPIKRIFMSYNDRVSEKEEKWLRDNLEELEFFEPSDSEEEVEVYGEEDDDDDSEDWETDSDAEGGDGGDGREDGEDGDEPPLISPLARHLGRRRRRAMDLD